jgi:hypothetical protein
MWVRGRGGGSSWDERAVGAGTAGAAGPARLSRMSIKGDVLWAVPCRFPGSVQGPLQQQSRGDLLLGLEQSAVVQWSFPTVESPRLGKTI